MPVPHTPPDRDLVESEEKYRALFTAVREGFTLNRAIYDEGGTLHDFLVLDANPAAERFNGLARQDLVGKTWRELWPGAEQYWWDICNKVMLEGGDVRHENYANVHDRWYEVHQFRVAKDLLGSIFSDVTGRKRVEQALREGEKRFRTLFETMTEGFSLDEIVCDGDGKPVDLRYLEVNPAFERHTGLKAAEIVGRTLLELFPDAEPTWVERYGNVALTGEPAHFEGSFGPLGRWFEVSAYQTEPGRFAVVFFDTTERKKAAEALRAANLQLVEADRRKSDFLAVLSHELRNPLVPIRNSVHLLERAPPGSEQAAKARDVIRRQTDHLTRLVDDLLDVTRISRGKIELQRARIDLRDVVRRACDDHRTLFQGRGVLLRVETPDPVWIDADETRIAQVVANLLQNAAKFSHEGHAVVASVGTADGQAEIRVRDEGIGIRPDLLPRLFEPFVQAEGGLARTKGGLGLGLALVKGLVQLHGGSVRASSGGEGLGAELVVKLPLARAPERPAIQAVAPGPARGLEILVIEDNVDVAQTVAEVLEMEGHRVHVAIDGASGIAKARELEPEVILCDIGLPDIDGYEIARTLRAADALRATRLVALSGYAQPEDRRRAIEAGFDAHLAKPPSLEQLLASLSRPGRR